MVKKVRKLVFPKGKLRLDKCFGKYFPSKMKSDKESLVMKGGASRGPETSKGGDGLKGPPEPDHEP